MITSFDDATIAFNQSIAFDGEEAVVVATPLFGTVNRVRDRERERKRRLSRRKKDVDYAMALWLLGRDR